MGEIFASGKTLHEIFTHTIRSWCSNLWNIHHWSFYSQKTVQTLFWWTLITPIRTIDFTGRNRTMFHVCSHSIITHNISLTSNPHHTHKSPDHYQVQSTKSEFHYIFSETNYSKWFPVKTGLIQLNFNIYSI
jgi:hypothetical protein